MSDGADGPCPCGRLDARRRPPRLHERSRFVREAGRGHYVDGNLS